MSEFKKGLFQMGRCRVIVSMDKERWHLTISCRDNAPSFKEIKQARLKFIPGDVVMAQIFPPSKEYVNQKQNCHHLWQIKEDF